MYLAWGHNALGHLGKNILEAAIKSTQDITNAWDFGIISGLEKTLSFNS
jgi:hypothetical protein